MIRDPNKPQDVRDGKDMLPEPIDMFPASHHPTKKEQDDDLDEALRETFPASDPIASGHSD
ncbi:hypothetical protein [Rhizobium oryzicola]|uniref:Uncharacterized protein n=1 Tax=Rhizobium oryzicola TaxID=1232668 RepID=A0ABT8T3K6_9HYPH|nr:hypothetical protein [Rhizobium oryzicola]MDO1585302.1 hypothetical protein [Rhizobium oryzicola]